MCAGADEEERGSLEDLVILSLVEIDIFKAKWKVGKATDYRYLNQGGSVEIPGVDDEDDFEELKVFSVS